VEEVAVGAGADLIDDIGLQITVDSARDVFSLASFGKEGAKSLIGILLLALLGEVTIGLNTMLEAVKLPAGVGNLATSLADVDANDLTHFC